MGIARIAALRFTNPASLSHLSIALLLAAAGCFGRPELPGSGARELRIVDPSSRAAMRIDVGGELGTGTVVEVNDESVPDAIPTATIRDDTRRVLATPTKQWLHVVSGAEIPADGSLRLEPGYSALLPRSRSALIVPRAKVGDVWRDLPTEVVEVKGRGEAQHVAFTLDFGADRGGEKADIHIDAFPLDWGDAQSYETGTVVIGRENRLDFAFGILEEAWTSGPVRFSVEWCETHSCNEIFEETLDPSEREHQDWIERSVALSADADREGHLVFKSVRIGRNVRDYSFPVWANPTIVRPEKPARGPYNVILLSIDTQRADHLTSYGYEHDTSPFMDRAFARDGVVFESMVASASSTSPAHMTMFTGMQASAHGLTQGLEELAPWIGTFTESIRDAGYETGAVTEDGWLGKQHGFARGFNEYIENRSPNIMAPTGQVDVTFERAKKWLERHKDRRFFLFLHTFQVHDPFSPPQAYTSMFREQRGEAIDDSSPWYQRWLMAYDQEIRYTDDELAGLWGTVEKLGIAEDTIFIITSDHGENFMEHGYFGHGAHLHEAVVRVPLIVHGPGIVRGRRVDELVGHVDLAPTVLELMGVDLPTRQLQGRSLLPYLRGEDDPSVARPVYFTESWAPQARVDEQHFEPFLPPAFSARRGMLKLARYATGDGFTFEAFDLARDPGERRNLWRSDRERFAELALRLESYEGAMHAFRERLEGADVGGGASEPKAVGLDPEQEEKLKALGYLN
jgi:arylsulfatase A-like enzyme